MSLTAAIIAAFYLLNSIFWWLFLLFGITMGAGVVTLIADMAGEIDLG